MTSFILYTSSILTEDNELLNTTTLDVHHFIQATQYIVVYSSRASVCMPTGIIDSQVFVLTVKSCFLQNGIAFSGVSSIIRINNSKEQNVKGEILLTFISLLG